MTRTTVGQAAGNYNFGCKYKSDRATKIIREDRNYKFWMVELSDGTFYVRTPLREWKVDKFYPVRFLNSDFERLFIGKTDRTIAYTHIATKNIIKT
ncbi:MAG: hypothetical protein ACOYJ1_00955 [Peptococcales bacterium]|jgi:hypothetical protein